MRCSFCGEVVPDDTPERIARNLVLVECYPCWQAQGRVWDEKEERAAEERASAYQETLKAHLRDAV